MSLLSIITNRLPNLLEFVQGTWDIQYNNPTNWIQRSTSDITWDENWQSLDFDTVIEINGVQESSVVTHPVETGGFRAVNKVRKPRIVRVKLAKGGNGYGIEAAMDVVTKLQKMASLDSQSNQNNNSLVQSAVNMWNNAKSAISGFVNNALSFLGGGLDIFRSGSSGASEYVSLNKIRPVEFRVITPFNMIEHLTLQKFDYTFRKETGRNMLILDLTLQEIISDENDGGFKLSSVKSAADAAKKFLGQITGR